MHKASLGLCMFISSVLLKQTQEAEHRPTCPAGVVLEELTAATGTSCPSAPQPGLSSGLLEHLLHQQLQGAAAAAAPREGRGTSRVEQEQGCRALAGPGGASSLQRTGCQRCLF